MLETIHEYARERLSRSGEERQLRERHLAFFLALAEETEPGYYRHGQLLLLMQTEAELGNFRAAFNWALEDDNVEAAARIVSSIEYFFRYRDRFIEGYMWMKRVLDHKAALSSDCRLKMLPAASRLAWANHDLGQCRLFGREALLLSREVGDRRSQAHALLELGLSAINQPNALERAMNDAEAGLALFRELDDMSGMSWALNGLGELARTAGDYDRAEEFYEEGMQISRKTGEVIRLASVLENLAYVAYHHGDYNRARDLAREAVMHWAEIGGRQGLCDGLAVLAGPLSKLGEPGKAARLLGASDARLAEIGIAYQLSDQPEVAKYTDEVRGELDKAAFEAAWAEGQAMTLDEAIAYALEGQEAQV